MSAHDTGCCYRIRCIPAHPDDANGDIYEVDKFVPVNGELKPHRDYEGGQSFKSRQEAKDWIRKRAAGS